MADTYYLARILILLTFIDVCTAQVTREPILEVLSKRGMKTVSAHWNFINVLQEFLNVILKWSP